MLNRLIITPPFMVERNKPIKTALAKIAGVILAKAIIKEALPSALKSGVISICVEFLYDEKFL